MIVYDGTLAYVTFNFYSGSTRKKESFFAKPTLLQFHPKDKDKIIKIHFAEKMPKWMKNFAQKYNYSLVELDNEQVGFALTLENKNFSVNPLFKGIIHEWFSCMDSSLNKIRNLLLTDIELVRQNLIYRKSFFEEIGLFYCLEEFEKTTGALYYGDWVTQDFENLEDTKQKEWLQLVSELTFKGEFQLEEDNDWVENENGKELADCTQGSNNIVRTERVEEVVLDDILHVEEPLVKTEDIVIDTTEVEPLITIDDLVIEESKEDDSLISITDISVETDEEIKLIESDKVKVSNDNSSKFYLENELKVATYRSKKEGIVEGQILLF
ncbi:hypothetical protein ACOMCU_22485 [Lysinibacillus sp. UGB7]|uniref:hypothetical protein n=1 Tax=Lysinibacillus sp. UGB7 TaxID=3411039 RepID=UPI003B7D1BAA